MAVQSSCCRLMAVISAFVLCIGAGAAVLEPHHQADFEGDPAATDNGGLSLASFYALYPTVLWIPVQNKNCIKTCKALGQDVVTGGKALSNQTTTTALCGMAYNGTIVPGTWLGRKCETNGADKKGVPLDLQHCGCLPKPSKKFWQWVSNSTECGAGFQRAPRICRVRTAKESKPAWSYQVAMGWVKSSSGCTIKLGEDYVTGIFYDRLCVKSAFRYTCMV